MPTPSSEPQWLSEKESRAWWELERVTLRLPAKLDARLRREFGLTHFEYVVLAMLTEQAEEVLGMTALSVLTNGSLSRLSHVVTRMERSGWVRRQPNPANARLNDVALTEAGRRKVEEAAPGHLRNARDLVFDHLSARQVAELTAALRRIAREPDGDACGSE